MSGPILPERGPNRRPDGPPAVRGHLERLIGHYAELTGVTPDRVRRWVSVMVLLGALDRVGEEEMPKFLLKGGIAIELRFGTDARATKDIDLVFFGDPQVLEDDLDAALDRDYSQFAFQRQQVEQMPGTPFHRLSVKLLYRGRSWVTLKLEVAPPDARDVDRESVPAIDIAEFGLDGPKVVQCLSTRFQIAQKIHAVTECFEKRENERFRDLIDLLLLREIVEDLPSLRDACIVTFEARGKHGWPPRLSVPGSWAEPYRTLAEEMQFPVANVDDAADDVRAFIAAIDAEA
ncbi:MAG: nucleotidyl transferase AbiEii/AbiGii toxin family protein [Solirubrobacterales bacterium]